MADQTTPGATPATTDATSNTTTTPASAATPAPATGDDAQLGDAGKRAIQAERARAEAAEERAKIAEKERDALRTASMTDQEKAIADARKAGETDATTRAHTFVRRAEVRRALGAAGASDVDLAALAPEF